MPEINKALKKARLSVMFADVHRRDEDGWPIFVRVCDRRPALIK